MIKDYKLVIIRPCGRSGSIFLQSLFDNHPQVLSFPMVLPFFYHWNIFYGSRKHTIESLLEYFLNRTDLRYLFNKETPKSYVCIDKKGKKFEFKIDKGIFVDNIKNELFKHGIDFPTRKEFLISLHEAYAKTIGADLKNKKLILLHEHGPYRMEDPNQDFKNILNIVTVREPYNSYASFIEYRIKFGGIFGPIYNILDINAWVYMLVNTSIYFKKFPKNIIFIKTEDLNANPRKQIDKLICRIGINFHPFLLKSTYAGFPKSSDISAFGTKKSSFNKEGMAKNRWKYLCSKRELKIIDMFFKQKGLNFGYNQVTKPKTTFEIITTILKPDLELLRLRYSKLDNLVKYIVSLNPIWVRLGLIRNLIAIKNIKSRKYSEASLLNSNFFDILRYTFKLKSLFRIGA